MPNSMIKTYNIILTLGFSQDEHLYLKKIFPDNFQLEQIDLLEEEHLHDSIAALSAHVLFLIVDSTAFELHPHIKHTLKNVMYALPTVLAEKCKLSIIDKRLFFKVIPYPPDESDIRLLLRNLNARYSMLISRKNLEKEYELILDLYNQKQKAFAFISECMQSLKNVTTVKELYENIRFSFENLLPLQSIHLVNFDSERNKIHIILGANENNTILISAWKDSILSKIKSMKPINIHTNENRSDLVSLPFNEDFTTHFEAVGNFSLVSSMPKNENVHAIPLLVDNTCVGALVLQLSFEPDYGKDLTLALDLVTNHIALISQRLYAKENGLALSKNLEYTAQTYSSFPKNIVKEIHSRQQ